MHKAGMHKAAYDNGAMESAELFEKKYSILQEISNFVVATDNITSIANLMLDLSNKLHSC